MQKFGFAPSKIKEEVVFSGVTFTMVQIVYDIDDAHRIVAEGVSRRSRLDAMDASLGRSIASGRALKALKKKLLREPIRNHFMG